MLSIDPKDFRENENKYKSHKLEILCFKQGMSRIWTKASIGEALPTH